MYSTNNNFEYKNKATIIILLIIIVFTFVACGNYENDIDEEETTKSAISTLANVITTSSTVNTKLPEEESSSSETTSKTELQKEESQPQESTEITQPSVEKPDNSNNKKKYIINEEVIYNIVEIIEIKDTKEVKYSISYPKLSGLEDYEMQEQINVTIKNEALKVMKYYENLFGSVQVTIDYEVSLASSSFLSIKYIGIGVVSNAAHPNKLFYTTNINLKTGEKFQLKEIVNIDNEFINLFLNNEFIVVNSFQDEVLEWYQFTSEYIQKVFYEADSLDSIGTDSQSDVFSYLTPKSLGISIYVPYAIGGHAEFEIEFGRIYNNKTENKFWENFLD